ncbi:PH domain-containing protein [Haloferacaceae archaeon DSL9]
MIDPGDWLRLSPEEILLWAGRPRTARILPEVAVGLVVVAVAVGLAVSVDTRLLAVALVGLPIPLSAYLRVTNTEFVVTTHGVWVKSGVLGRSVDRVTLDRVQNIAYRQSIRGSAFGYGTIVAEVAGGDDAVLFDIDDPQYVYELLRDFLGDDRADDIPGRLEQWLAVLDEVRALRRALDHDR